MSGLTIIALGAIRSDDVRPLANRFAPLEQIDLPLPPRAVLEEHKGELNRAIAAAANEWVLILREREFVDPELAEEIYRATVEPAKAWAYRLRSIAFYNGAPLRIGQKDDGEIRLFHRRHYVRFEAKKEATAMRVQGTVIRLDAPLRSMTFATPEEHLLHLERTAVNHSFFRRLGVFAQSLVTVRTLDANTIRYLWIEAAYGEK
jgi:hypothetical protein